MRLYTNYELGWLKVVGGFILLALLLFVLLGYAEAFVGTKIRIENVSEKATIHYWVVWKNPIDEEGNPLKSGDGMVISDMNIMGGELKAGDIVVSDSEYKPGEYYLVWSSASNYYDNKMTEFTIEPGTEVHVILIYSSGD